MSQLEHRAYLLHLTHYSPPHVAAKATETPFALATAKRMVDAVADAGFNLLLIGVSDGIVYASHPEFRRHYSQPRKQLQELAAHARQRGLAVAPKLNFSESEINCHNHWMRAPGEEWHTHFDDDYYWKTAFECIDEVIELCRPEAFFHVGMDEDHNRSYSQYVEAVRRLDAGIRTRGLTSLSWSDSGLDYPSGQIYVEKSLAAEDQLPTALVRVLWNYWAVPEAAARSILAHGNRLWCAPGHKDAAQTRAFRDLTKELGGDGIVMTHWIIATAANEETLITAIRENGKNFTQ
jgi:hypothetical protein